MRAHASTRFGAAFALALATGGCTGSFTTESPINGAGGSSTTPTTTNGGGGATGHGGAGQGGHSTTQTGLGGGGRGGGTGQGGAGPCVGPGPSGDGTVFALSRILLGDTNPDGTPNPQSGWKQYGFDLDGKVSTKASKDLCQPSPNAWTSQVYPDGNDGIDNSFGKNILPMFLGLWSDISVKMNDQIAAGSGNFLLDLVGVGQGQDTCGFSARYDLGSKLDAPPSWNGSDVWPVDPVLLANPQDITSTTALFQSADLVANHFRTNTQATVVLRLDFAGAPLALTIGHARMAMNLDAGHTGAQGGMLGGVIDTEAFTEQLKSVLGSADPSLCSGMTLDGILTQIRLSSDILKDGTQDPSKTCDGISIGIGFEAKKVVLGGIGPTTPPPPNPCAPGP
jgi:hypothetical protein